MAERKSKPKKAEVDVDEDAHKKTDGILLLGLVVGAVAIILGMVVVSNFLSQGKTTDAVLYSFIGVAVLDTAIFVWGYMARRKAAQA